jgi:predicted enzyme related to lactoylglutathione lyase
MMQKGMGSRLVALCFDANDPLRLARFWAEALHWEIDDETHDEIGLVPTDDTRFGILFLPVPEQKAGTNRLHLDLTTTSIDDQKETVGRLVELGARHIDIGQRPDEGHVVLADPEGNEFCVIEPDNSFLADCGRLGSITCDGTREVGYFWSEALGWPLVWDQDEETAIRAPDGTGPFITWGWSAACPEDREEQASSRHRPARPRRSASGGRPPHLPWRDSNRHRPRRCELGGHDRSRWQRVLCVEPPIGAADVLPRMRGGSPV